MASDRMLEALLTSIASKQSVSSVHVRTDVLTQNYLRKIHVLPFGVAREKGHHHA